MGRRNIGISTNYIIVGVDEDDVEHFIGSSCGAGWLTMMFRTFRYKFNSRYRERYKHIYLKKLYEN